jgi:hypothetical protein
MLQRTIKHSVVETRAHMRKSFLFLLLVISLGVSAQDTTAVKAALDRLEMALVARDTMTMKQLLHMNLQFGHSNGWVQTKRDAIEDAKSGALVYGRFDRQSLTILSYGKTAVVREWVNVSGTRNGTEFNVKLFVMQHWVRTKKGWQLLFRQGARQA